MSVDAGGNGIVLIGPPGTNKTELFFGLLRDPKFRFHSSDTVFVRYSGKAALADNVERKVYMPTNVVELFPRLAALFDGSKCENIVTRKEDCTNAECLRGEDCRLDRGSPFCYKAAKEGQAMLDPNWIGGPAGCARRATVRWVFILRNDAISPGAVELGPDEALRILESGESPGFLKSANAGELHPYFNPHLLLTTEERLSLQKTFYQRLLGSAAFYLFNSGVAGVEKIKEIVGPR
jgi:hypothetical protein